MWANLGLPFETASARVVLGHAHHRAGNDDCARAEWQAAQQTFESYGAERWAAYAAELLADIGAASQPAIRTVTVPATTATMAGLWPGSGKESAVVFRRSGDSRTVRHDGIDLVRRDLKGFRYIERLLAHPGREFHVLHLAAAEEGTSPAHHAHTIGDGLHPGGHSRLAWVSSNSASSPSAQGRVPANPVVPRKANTTARKIR